MKRTVAGQGWLHLAAGCAVAGIALLLDPGPAGGVPVTAPSRLPQWWAANGPIMASFSAVRLAVLVGGIYWAVLGAAAVTARWAGSGSALCGRLSRLLPGFRLVAAGVAGGSIAGCALLGCAGQSVASPGAGEPPTSLPASPASRPVPSAAPEPPRLIPLDPPTSKRRPVWPEPASSTTTPRSDAAPASAPAVSPPAVNQPAVNPTAVSPAPSPVEVPTAAPMVGSAVQSAPAGGRSAAVGQWTVRAGDNLWSIAESVVAAHLARPPSDSDTASYWLRLIALNRSRLPDPSNPGLIFAGDSIKLPAL